MYPRIREDAEAIERYRAALDKLPPIVVARGHILVDGWHRWQAHKKEGAAEIRVQDLGNLADIEILKEAIVRNAAHGHQLSQKDKEKMAGELYDRGVKDEKEIMRILSVSDRSVRRWLAESKAKEREKMKAKAWDLWLNCLTEQAIADNIGIPRDTVHTWIVEIGQLAKINKAPGGTPDNPWGRVQHFDIWQFQSAGSEDNNRHFGRMPSPVVENLLWLYTEPGDIIVDPFAGGGTTIDVAKDMGRRVWASDLHPSTPLLPIHQHDIATGWPDDAPKKAKLILLDPPYWEQAKGRYSQDGADLGNMSLSAFYAAWSKVIAACAARLADSGRLAYIISPTQCDDHSVVDHPRRRPCPLVRAAGHGLAGHL